uniref:Uncharacterized protein n=1 Tax=Arundo donax TaxID=35708 RepID=A0A0A9CWF6_ARUDO
MQARLADHTLFGHSTLRRRLPSPQPCRPGPLRRLPGPDYVPRHRRRRRASASTSTRQPSGTSPPRDRLQVSRAA